MTFSIQPFQVLVVMAYIAIFYIAYWNIKRGNKRTGVAIILMWVTVAIDAAKKKQLEIVEEEAKAEIAMTKKRSELSLAQANYEIEITEAKAIRDANKIIAQGITPSLLKLKQINVNRIVAERVGVGDKVFLPMEAMGSTGAQVRMYK